MTLVWGIIAFTALMAFVSLAVDLGRVQLARTELQQAADAAARFAAVGLVNGVSAAQDNAVAAAAENRAAGKPVVLVRDEDVEFGTWDAAARTFTPSTGAARATAGAIRVTARRTARRGNAVALMFTSWVGKDSCDVSATTIVTRRPIPSAFIALGTFAVKNNLFAASYDSAIDVSPTTSSHAGNGMIGSNGALTAKHNEIVGSVVLGPDGSHDLTLAAPATVLAHAIPAPAIDFGAAPATNPGGVAKALNVTGTTTLGAGVYHFTSIHLANNATLTFTGPATVYVDGSVTYANRGTIRAADSIPGNLRIRQRGAGTVFGGATANDVIVIADVEAPQTNFIANNTAHLRGRAVFNDVDAKNNAEFYYDESLHASLGVEGGAIAVVR